MAINLFEGVFANVDPGYVGRPFRQSKQRVKWGRPSNNKAHQGKREMARRVRKMGS